MSPIGGSLLSKNVHGIEESGVGAKGMTFVYMTATEPHEGIAFEFFGFGSIFGSVGVVG